MSDAPQSRPLRIGVSACVVGREVRYDGAHRRDGVVAGTLGASCIWVEVCPEVELGLGVPRPTLRLEDGDDGVRMVTTDGATDHTVAMRRFAEARALALAAAGLDGFVLKGRSPSCGLARVRVYGADPLPRFDGAGLFAAALARRLPHLPVEEAERLHDPALRARFVAWAEGERAWREMEAEGLSAAALRGFHRRHRPRLAAGDPAGAAALDRVLDEAGSGDLAGVAARYHAGFTAAMRGLPGTAGDLDAVRRAAATLGGRPDAEDRAELEASLDACDRGEVPLVVPLTLLKRLLRRQGTSDAPARGHLAVDPATLALYEAV